MVYERLEKGRTHITVIGAITLRGVPTPLMLVGAVDGDALEAYVVPFLVPQLRRGDIVIWDNVPTHKKLSVVAVLEATGPAWNACPPTRPT